MAVATAIYAWVANRARREAAKAADEQRRLAASDAAQIAAALDRLTAAIKAAPAAQPTTRPLLVVNLGRPGRRP